MAGGIQHTPTIYFMLDAAGTVVEANACGATQLGYTVDELVGQSVLKCTLRAPSPAITLDAQSNGH